MQLAVVDGMGGGLGAQLTEKIDGAVGDEVEIIALGANAQATGRMLEAGADRGASRDNAIIHMSGRVDIIAGPLGIMIPNSMMGEISPAVAEAVARSGAKKFILSIQQPHFELIGRKSKTLDELLDELTEEIANFVEEERR